MNTLRRLSINAGWLASLILAGSLMTGCSVREGWSDTGASPLTVPTSSVAYETSAAQAKSGAGTLTKQTENQEFYLNDGHIGWKIEAQADKDSEIENTLYRTENGGAVWQQINDSQAGSLPSGLIGSARFADTNRAWLAVDSSREGDPRLYETRDGGATWSKTELKVPASFSKAWFEPKTPILFEGTDLGLFIAQTGYPEAGQEPNPLLFYVTADGGANWSDPLHGEEGEQGGLSWRTKRLADQTGRSWSITIDGRTWTFERSDK